MAGLGKSVTLLATAALGLGSLVGLAGPARATSGPGAPAVPVTRAAGHGFAMGDAAPPPAMPDPLAASGPPQVQALVQKYQADAQADQQKYNQLAAEKGTLDQRAGDVTARENSLAAQASDLKTQSDTLSAQAQTLSEQIAAHNAEPHVFQLPDQEGEYAAYNAEKARLDAQKAALQNQLNALSAQNDKLQADQAKADVDQTQLETDVETHNEAVTALEGDVQQLAVERQQILAQIAGLLQNYAETQQAEAAPAPGADQSAPSAAIAPPPQTQSLPSGGGDQAAPPAVPYVPATSAAPAAAPAPVLTQTPVTVTLAPSTVSGLSASQAENLSPSQTYSGLIPEANGDYAAAQVQPPPGTPEPPARKAFDDAVNKGGKATTPVGGKPATIDRVVPVRAAPAANQGGDTPRPAKAASSAKQQPTRIWTPKHSSLVTPTSPPVALSDLPSVLAERGLGDLAGRYDFELAPVIIDADGVPLLGSAPLDAAGNPLRGPDGKPVLRFSNLGLADPDRAVRAFTGDVITSDLNLVGDPKFKKYKYLTRQQLTSKQTAGYKYQAFATGQKYEEVWTLDGNDIEVDGGPGINNYIKEAKWTGAEGQWDKAGYNPARNKTRFTETTTVDQAARLLALNRALAGPGVIYYCSNPEGAAFYRAVFREWFPAQIASGELQVQYLSARGMRG